MSKTRNPYVETAVRPLYAVAGATDLAVELARGYVSEAQVKVNDVQQKATDRVTSVDLEPKVLGDKAVGLAKARVDELTGQARARQVRFEKRVTGLSDQARAIPGKVESYVNGTVADLTETYSELASRGEQVVGRIRNQQSTKDAVSAVKNTESRAKATVTTAEKAADATQSRVKATATTAKKSAAATRSSAKATTTTAKKGASDTTTAAKKGASATTSSAKGTATTAKKGASATKSSAKGATTTAKKGAASTRSAAKATGTTAKKAAAETAQAVTDAAEKIGD